MLSFAPEHPLLGPPVCRAAAGAVGTRTGRLLRRRLRREWNSAPLGLCAAHEDQRRALQGVGVEQLLIHRQVEPLAPLAFCAGAACTRQRRHPDGLYSEAHQQRLHNCAKLTGTCAAEQEVHRAPDAGRYVLTAAVASGPAMFDTARLDQAG